MRYPVTLTRDTNNTYLVRFPDVPGAVTYGETIRDAMAHARDAFLTVVDALIKDRKPVPAPSPIGRRQLFVVIPAREAAKIELYRTMQAKKVGKAELGRRLEPLRLRDGWLYTRDIVEVDDDGYLLLVDRIDNIIILFARSGLRPGRRSLSACLGMGF